MSQSALVNYTLISPFQTKPRVYPITKITIHHMAGNLTVEQCGKVFQSRQASSQYGIGSDGRVGQYVLEENRAWCSANYDNDHRAINIEVANDGGAPDWHVSDKALSKLIDLCVDVCRRNGISRLNYTGDKTGNLTTHQFFISTACPGPYLKSKFPWIAEQVNSRLSGSGGVLPRTTPVQVICGPASSGDIKTFANALQKMSVAAIYPKDGYIASAVPLSYGDQKTLVDLGFSLSVGVEPYEVEKTFGTPVKRDIYKNQLEVTIDDLYCRTEPNLSSATRLGFITPGIYNIYQEEDKRKTSGNGYYWYRVEDKLWVPFDDDWMKLYPTQEKPSTDIETKLKELQAQYEKLLQENSNLKTQLSKAQKDLESAKSQFSAAKGDLQSIAATADKYKN